MLDIPSSGSWAWHRICAHGFVRSSARITTEFDIAGDSEVGRGDAVT
ncbi:hypothetical protein [Arthrobacter sp. U41]|nr:hypothetical protein [Arthrobacter sp. U41]